MCVVVYMNYRLVDGHWRGDCAMHIAVVELLVRSASLLLPSLVRHRGKGRVVDPRSESAGSLGLLPIRSQVVLMKSSYEDRTR